MSYAKPGYYEVPAGKTIISYATSLRQEPSFERDLAKTIDKLGRGGRRIASMGLEDVVALDGEGLFSAGTPQLSKLQHILLRFLYSLGTIDRYPRIVGYRVSPYLTINECLDLMMSTHVQFPSLDGLGGAANFNIEALKGVLPTVIREIAYKDGLRAVYGQRLRLKLGQIGFRLATGQPITQQERSFFVNFVDPFNPRGFINAAEAVSGMREKVAVADSGDSLVADTWNLFTSTTEQGPYLRFMSVQSNTNMENLVYWYGPQQAALSFGVAYRFGYGRNYDEPRVQEAIVLPWSSQDQLVATRERSMAFNVAESSAVFHPPVISMVGSSLPFLPTWDLPEVDIRVNLNSNDCVPTEYSFWSAWRERMLSTRLNASPQTLLTDLALTRERLGDAQHTGLALQSWDLLDLNASAETLGKQTYFSPSYEERIVVPNRASSRATETITVNMSDFYHRMGTVVFPPAFREFVMCPLSWLHVPDEAAENFISARLGLTEEQSLQAKRTIRISHNFHKLKRLLPDVRQLPISEAGMNQMCKALLGAL